MRRFLTWLILPVAAALTADWANNTAGRQKWTILLNSTERQRVVCVHHKPLRVERVAASLLELFLVQRISINSTSQIEVTPSSEDTWLEGAVGSLDALQQLEATFRSAAQDESWLRMMRTAFSWLGAAVTALTEEGGSMWTQSFSPFSSSCVALRLRPGFWEAAVECEARLVGPLALSNGHRSIGADQVESGLWLGPALALAGLLLFWYAPFLSQSLPLYYASGMTLGVVLGVALLLFFVVKRVSPRRGGGGTLLALATGWAGSVYAAARHVGWRLLAEHWPKVLAYLALFGLLGYALTKWTLRGGRPEAYQCELLAQAMRLVALLCVLFSSVSVRASGLLLASLLLAWGMPRGLLRVAARLVSKLAGRAPSWLVAGAPREHRMWWMPPTTNGQFLTQEEYETRRDIATDNGLRALLSSPEYQSWALRNHSRFQLAPEDGEQAETCSDMDDD